MDFNFSGSVSDWLTAGGTVGATIGALFGWRLVDAYQQPRLQLSFDPSPPYCRSTTLATREKAHWLRVRVANSGRSGARSCVARLTKIETEGQPRNDIDPMQLRWCGVPDHRGFEAIELARGQFEFFDVLRIPESGPPLIETFPGYSPGHPMFLECNQAHRLTLVVSSNNAEPAELIVAFYYDGTFAGLPATLSARAE